MRRQIRPVLAMLVLVPACEQVKKVDGEDGGACVPAEVQAAFTRSCGPGVCHVNGNKEGMLSLDPGQSALAIGKSATGSPLPLIDLGNTGNSYLAQKLMSDPAVMITGDRMPIGFSASNEDQVADVNTILTWIGGGVFECGADTDGTTTMGETGTTGNLAVACGLQDLAPGANAMIMSGPGVGQIPPDIATILESNCGCHYSNELATNPYIDYLEGMGTQLLDMRTIAGFQMLNAAMPPVPYHELTLARVTGSTGQVLMPPPEPFCNEIPPVDYDTLVEWLGMGAPDGATWTGGSASEHVCGIEDLKPGAPNPIQAGMGAGQIPPDIGTILANNCGCHYADDLAVAVPDYLGTADIATHAGFQAPFGAEGPLHVTALDYVTNEFMPLGVDCELSDATKLAESDYRVLTRWLGQGAPDGMTWVP